MKNLILIFFLLIASVSFAQVDTSKWGYNPSGSDGKYGTVQNVTDFPDADSGMVKAQLVYVINPVPATTQFSFVDTVTQVIDTVSRQILSGSNSLTDTFKVWVRFTFYAIGDSILEVSPYPSMPNNHKTRIKGGGRWTTEKLDVRYFPNFFVRGRFPGVKDYEVIIEGQGMRQREARKAKSKK